MHPEDRFVLSNLLSDAKITNDIWFAVEQGFIPSSDLSNISESSDYENLLIELFKEWYNESWDISICIWKLKLNLVNKFFKLRNKVK